MYEKSGGHRFLVAFPPRLLVLAFSFFAAVLAALLAVTCFILALDKRSDPNAAVSLPGNQKFATFFTAGIFLIVLPIPLIAFLSIILHTRHRYSPLSKSSRSKLHNLVTLQWLSLPPTQPFLFFSSNVYRTILLIAFLVQLADTVALTIVVCIMKNNEICLFAGRVVLCNLLTSAQKVGIIIPAFLQIFSQFVLFLLIKPYTRQVENESGLSMDFDEVFGPVKGTKGQGPFQRIPVFDVDMDPENGNGVLEEGIDLTDTTRYDRGAGDNSKPIPVKPENKDRTNSFDYSTPYDDPYRPVTPPTSAGFKQQQQTMFKKYSKPTRTLSTSSMMQGPRPAPKRSGTLMSVASTPSTTTLASPSSITSGKNKEWFKRFKSKTTTTTTTTAAVDEDEDDEGSGDSENEALVPGSERKRTTTRTSKKRPSDVSRQGDGGEADGEDEGLL